MSDFEAADIVSEPIIVLDVAGRVARANRAARRLFDGIHPGTAFSAHAADKGELQELLRRMSNCAQASFGSLGVTSASGVTRYRISGARLSPVGAAPMIGLRFLPYRTEEFSALSMQVNALNAEIFQHRLAKQKLQEAAETNITLYRELQHRVKNHLQMVLGMFGVARRRTTAPGERKLLEELERRVGAMSEAQHLMYAAKGMKGVRGDQLIGAIADRFRSFGGPELDLSVKASVDELPNETASPVALILNELLSNATRYGASNGSAVVAVEFGRRGDSLELIVQDQGPGFHDVDVPARGSGLGLVRGLCRQLGASLSLENCPGARCTVRLASTTKVMH